MAASSSAAEASGSGASEPTDESLKLAEQNFNDGIQAIKVNLIAFPCSALVFEYPHFMF